jgi:hypothetical protein
LHWYWFCVQQTVRGFMPTYTVGSGKTYSTITAAFSAIPSNISGTGVHEVVVDAGTYLTGSSGMALSKSGASATDYIHLRAATGSEHNGTYSGVIIGRDNSWGSVLFSCSTAYTRISNIVFISQTVSTDPFTRADVVSIGAQNCRLTNVIGIGGGTAYLFNSAGANGSTTYINCIAARHISASTSPAIGFYLFANDVAYNCGAYETGQGFKASAGVDGLVRNCWAFKRSTDVSAVCFVKDTAGNSWLTSSNNASSDSTAPGSNSLTSLSAAQLAFVSVSTYNFHITSTSSLFGAGVDLSSIFTTDFDNETIRHWCIGPDDPPAPDPYQPTSSTPWTGQIEVGEKVSEAEAFSPKTRDGDASDTGRKSSNVRDVQDFSPVTQAGESSVSDYSETNVPDAEGYTPTERSKGRDVDGHSISGKLGQRTGFLSFMPELNGYGISPPGLGTGFYVPFLSESLGLGKEFRDLDSVGAKRINNQRRAMYNVPQGRIKVPVRSQDVVPLLQAHFQRCIGTTVIPGTTYYEFVPSKGRVDPMRGNGFGTGSFSSVGSSEAFSLSVYKGMGANEGILFKNGVIDRLTFKLHAMIEPTLEADFRFREGTIMATQASHPYGSYSQFSEFTPSNCNVDFLGLPVLSFEFTGDNRIENRFVTGANKPVHRFGQYELRGKVTVDLSKDVLRHFATAMSGSTFPVSATMYNAGHDQIVFQFPDCRMTEFPIGASDIYTVPFQAYMSEDGSTAPVNVKLWTKNYSATTFEPY